MTSLLLTGIAELVTNDPAHDGTPLGVLADAAVVVEGRPGRLGRAAQRRPPTPTPCATSAAARCSRASSTPTPTSSSPATGPRSSRPGWPARATPAAASAPPSPPPAPPPTSSSTANVARHVAEMRRQGTTTVEIKSGYGLTVLDEARSLAVARQFTDETTFLGAHVVPPEYAEDPAGVRRPRHRPDAGRRGAARALDRRLLRAGRLRRRPGADDPRGRGRRAGCGAGCTPTSSVPGPGVRLACELGLTAVDHCTYLDAADVAALAASGTVATLLPGVEFSTRSPYPDARGLLDAGVTVALASDCNPGSCYTSSMPLCVALAVREMRMTPAEALWSATAGGARALDRDDVGRARPGKPGAPHRPGGAVPPAPRLPARRAARGRGARARRDRRPGDPLVRPGSIRQDRAPDVYGATARRTTHRGGSA